MKSNSATADFNYCHYTGFRLRPLCCWIVVAFLAATPAFSQPHLFLEKAGKYQLSEQGASFLASLPMRCWEKEFPYKTGITFLDSSFITAPKNYHPAFYGCFDWHSSVHGHWMLVKLVRDFPGMPEAAAIRAGLKKHLSAVNLQKELLIFRAENLSFERIYGWAWLLYLQRELTLWDDPLARELQNNLKPLAAFFSQSWQTFLSKIAYPIRVGEHTNLAFGLSLSWDYAQSVGDTLLQNSIRQTAARFYRSDKACPIAWEPGGYDFLSPCLEEARLMSRLLDGPRYLEWLQAFLPGLFSKPADLLKVGIVRDRSDGKLVHLDGLNFSRAWCLLEIAEKLPKRYAAPVQALAARHLSAALPNVVSGSYAGEHWLASFAVYALSKEK